MKAKSFKRVLALALATTMILSACGQKPAANTSETVKTSESAPAKESEAAPSETEPAPVKKEDLPVITLYPRSSATFSGLVTGHRSDYFAEHGFQMEVWAYSAEKTTAMLTSGDLPDILYLGPAGTEMLETLITTDKIINYEDYKDQLPNFFENPYSEYVEDNIQLIRDQWSAGTGGLYILPWGLGDSAGKFAQMSPFGTRVPKVNWAIYEAIGAPEVTDFWSLLDIAEEMMAYQPVHEDGTKMYGMYLDTGLDTTKWGPIYHWYFWHGYETHAKHFIEFSNATGEMKSIFDDDSLYKEGLKWYNSAYRRGLMDPDSISTPREEQVKKVDGGYAMVPAGTLGGYPTTYYEVFPTGTVAYQEFTTKKMPANNTCIVINKETEHLEECLAFVNMLADPYAYLNMYYGPEGDIWQEDGNVLSITDEFAAWLKEKGGINGFPMSDGTEYAVWDTPSAMNTGVTITGYVDINGEPLPITPTSWPDAQAITTDNENYNAWKETMNAEDFWDYCEKNDVPVVTDYAFAGAVWPATPADKEITQNTIRDTVVNASWLCVYAESDEEFEKIWDQMVKDAYALGAEDIQKWFMEVWQPTNK